jgi:hypothetical protein
MRELLKTLQTNWCTLVLLTAVALLPRSSDAETPEQFAHRFANFKFEFHAEVQDPDVFLKTKKGDCDDFATLADDALTHEGYTTHLITVRMPGEAHVVLYVDQVHGYLDYNLRNAKHPVLACGKSLQQIATQVAASFHAPWVAAYEFAYYSHIKHLMTDIVMNDKVQHLADAPMQTAAAGSQRKGSRK